MDGWKLFFEFDVFVLHIHLCLTQRISSVSLIVILAHHVSVETVTSTSSHAR